MTIAFCLGNGISRRGIDLNALANYGAVYGCNALYTEFTPTALVATDTPIATAIQESGYSAKNRFYTRRPIAGLGGQRVPQKYYGSSSGPICISIAALDNHSKIYMLGYDMGPNEKGKFNNVYADCKHYKTSGAEPTFTGNWIRQIRTVVTDFPQTKFVRVKGATTADIPDLNSIFNLAHLPLETFLERINNGKDL